MTVWSEGKIATLRSMYSRGERAVDIAAALGDHTPHAIYVKASKLGLARTQRASRPICWATLLRRIESRVEVAANGCWNWTGSLDWSGYGRMHFRGKNARVCRVAWCAKYETEWPDGKHALHSCDNPKCVNPAHIRPGTNAENMREAWERGGHRKRLLANRTHCKRGHALTPENLITYPSIAPRQRCHACEQTSIRKRRA